MRGQRGKQLNLDAESALLNICKLRIVPNANWIRVLNGDRLECSTAPEKFVGVDR